MSLKDWKQNEVLYRLLGDQSVAEVVRRGRLRWFGHVERKNGDDCVPACRNVAVAQRCPWVGWTRGSGQVTILPDFGGSGQHIGFFTDYCLGT